MITGGMRNSIIALGIFFVAGILLLSRANLKPSEQEIIITPTV